MKRYEKYKDSGVEWLGEIPEHWTALKFKRLAKIKNGKDQKDVIISVGGFPVLGSGGEFGRASKYLYNKPSVLLGRKGTIDKPQYIEEPFWTVDTLFYTEIFDSVKPKFLYYLSLIIPFNYLQESSAVPSMTQEKLHSVFLCRPSLAEQIQIANYIDHQTTIINQLITEKELLITKLQEKRNALINEVVTKGLNPNAPMRDSGIEWLGMIPEHWKLSKMKFIGSVKGRIGFKGYSVTDLVDSSTPCRAIVLGGTNVMRSGFISYEKLTFLSCEKYEESPEIMLKGGEILITKVGAGVGENAIYTYYDDKVTINPNVMLLVVDNGVNEKFVNYFLLSDTIKSQIHIESQKSGAQPAINQSFLKNLPIFVPNKIEQAEIIDFIESRTTKIEQTISEIQIQIQKLKEYKTSVISEVVTGKVDVRDWEEKNN